MTATLPTTNDILQWALCYYARGWSIIPADPQTKKPCLKRWKQYQTQRPTETDLRKWFSSGKYTGLAVICGAVSGNLCVLDLDTPEACEWWDANHKDLPLPTASTRKGRHIFMRHPPFPKRNGKGVDLLSEGAYVILAPSPGKAWTTPPNGEIPEIDPFSLGLKRFGIHQESTLHYSQHDLCPLLGTSGRRLELLVSSSGELDEDEKREISTAIATTQPKQPGQRNAKIFCLAQWLDAIPGLRNVEASALKEEIKKWHEMARHVCQTQSWDETWSDFARAWNTVQWPKGDVVVKFAAKLAHQDTTMPPETMNYEQEETRMLLRFCYQMHLGMKRKPFFVSCRTAETVSGLKRMTAWKRLGMFVADGHLKVVQLGGSENHKRDATIYQYIERPR